MAIELQSTLVELNDKLIIVENLQEKLYKIYHELQNHYGCTYLSYRHEHLESKSKFNFSTNPDWNNAYIDNNLIDHCALIRDGKELTKACGNKDMLYRWDFATHRTNKEKIVRDARKDFGIFYGLTISIVQNNIRKHIGIATDEKNKNFIRYLLSDTKKLKLLFSYLRYYADNEIVKINNDSNMIISK